MLDLHAFVAFVSILYLIDFFFFFTGPCGWRVFVGAYALLCCAISGPR
jgi:hypothetical protein